MAEAVGASKFFEKLTAVAASVTLFVWKNP